MDTACRRSPSFAAICRRTTCFRRRCLHIPQQRTAALDQLTSGLAHQLYAGQVEPNGGHEKRRPGASDCPHCRTGAALLRPRAVADTAINRWSRTDLAGRIGMPHCIGAAFMRSRGHAASLAVIKQGAWHAGHATAARPLLLGPVLRPTLCTPPAPCCSLGRTRLPQRRWIRCSRRRSSSRRSGAVQTRGC